MQQYEMAHCSVAANKRQMFPSAPATCRHEAHFDDLLNISLSARYLLMHLVKEMLHSSTLSLLTLELARGACLD